MNGCGESILDLSDEEHNATTHPFSIHRKRRLCVIAINSAKDSRNRTLSRLLRGSQRDIGTHWLRNNRLCPEVSISYPRRMHRVSLLPCSSTRRDKAGDSARLGWDKASLDDIREAIFTPKWRHTITYMANWSSVTEDVAWRSVCQRFLQHFYFHLINSQNKKSCPDEPQRHPSRGQAATARRRIMKCFRLEPSLNRTDAFCENWIK